MTCVVQWPEVILTLHHMSLCWSKMYCSLSVVFLGCQIYPTLRLMYRFHMSLFNRDMGWSPLSAWAVAPTWRSSRCASSPCPPYHFAKDCASREGVQESTRSRNFMIRPSHLNSLNSRACSWSTAVTDSTELQFWSCSAGGDWLKLYPSGFGSPARQTQRGRETEGWDRSMLIWLDLIDVWG